MGRWFFLPFFLWSNCGHGLCVKQNQTKLYAGPGKNTAVTWVVGKNMPLLELERRGSWVKVEDQDSESHWVPRSALTNSFQCLSVSVPVATIRKGPSSKQPLHEYRQLDRYTALKKLGQEEDWIKVEDGFGQDFWIHIDLVWRPLKASYINF
jgi:SH3-like domain-containing protein